MSGPLSPAARLLAREEGSCLHALDRALYLLRLEESGTEDTAGLAVAERDRRLLERRIATYGDTIDCLADCPACGETQEFALSATALAGALTAPEEAVAALGPGGAEVALKPLDSRDLAAAALAADPDEAARILITRAIRSVDGRKIAYEDLPPALKAAVAAEIEAREALGETSLALSCAHCGANWTAGFDIGAVLYAEIEADARRLIGEVAALAERFGWSEADILALPPARRRAYLEAGRVS